jgi:hypothetical protein
MRRTNPSIAWGSFVVTTLTLVLAACGASPAADPTRSPPPSATVAAQPADELEGTWRTPEKTQADLVAAARTAGCSEEEIDSFFAGYTATTFVSTLRFEGGSFGEFQSYDGGPDESGSDGTYRLDDGQLILIDPGYSDMTLEYELEGDQLTLQLQNFDCGIDLDPAIIFEGAPFTREATG